MIAELRYFVPSSVLININKSLILLYFTYGLVAWGNASKNYLHKIIVLQKRVLRLIYFVDRKEHAIPLFVNEKILPVTFLYYEAVCKLMLDVHNDSAPSNIMKRLTRTSNIHTYITRSSTSQLFSVKYSRLKMQRKAFSRVGVEVWNEIPDEYKNLSKKSFKKYRKRALTSQYSRNWRFLNGAWWDNAKIQTQQNWTSSTICFVSLRTMTWNYWCFSRK